MADGDSQERLADTAGGETAAPAVATPAEGARAGAGDASADVPVAGPAGHDGAGQCMPCRGAGRVISNLGGERAETQCPWCGGSGVRVAGVDAQAHWAEPATS
ncbi:MAG: hypothetical protein KGJ43_00945 [Acidobacteriota bacterium]|nr:hypothetical protein [Acidobacteriota bacterium]